MEDYSSPSSSSRLATPEGDDFIATAMGTEPMLSLDDLLTPTAFQPVVAAAAASYRMPSKPIPPPTPIQRRPDPALIPRKTVFPDRNEVQSLSLVFPSLPASGTKSRVETQIRVVMDLTDSSVLGDPSQYNRVGSWKWLQLPDGTATKKRIRKQAKFNPLPEETLYMRTSVSCASPPYATVFCCSGCQSREAKRVAKKIAARIKPQYSDSDNPDADSTAKKPFQEDTSSILHFNCAALLDFSSGTANLPMRLTCYCRHHKEKLGFHVHITLLDHTGRVIATGSTPHVMITDDHKTMLARNNDAASPNSAAHPGDLSPSPDSRQKKPTRNRVKPYQTTKPHGPPKEAQSESSPSSPSNPAVFLPLISPTAPLPTVLPVDLHSPPTQTPPMVASSLESESSLEALATPLDYQSDVPMNAPLEDSSLRTIPPTHPHTLPFLMGDPSTPSSLPMINRLIPCTGPTHGGIEVTILGVNFHPSLTFRCVFGDVVSTSVQRWSDNTLVCFLPPRDHPGVVQVYLEGFATPVDTNSSTLFTYTSESDRALMELALQVVGLKMTGKLEDAKQVAMRIVGNSGNNTPEGQSTPNSGAPGVQFSPDVDPQNLESIIIGFLKLLESGPTVIQPNLAISFRNSSGHTLVHLAAFCGFTHLLEMLLEYQPDLDTRDRNGYTALHFAVLSGSASTVLALLASGADPQVVNSHGKRPQELASPRIFELFPSELTDETDEEESDDEAQWGDAEDDDASPPVITRSKHSRRTRTSPSTVSTAHDGPPSKIREEALNVRHMDKQAETLVEVIQRTLGDKIPGAQGLIDNIPALPGLFTLPQMLNIPVHPTIVNNFPALFGADVTPPNARGDDKAATLYDLRAMWERWFALAAAVAVKQQQDDPPPQYTPRAQEEGEDEQSTMGKILPEASGEPVNEQVANIRPSSSSATAATRAEFGDDLSAPPSNTEVAAYAYQPTRKQQEKFQKKEDRMLLLFWIPVLFLSLLWGFHSSVRFAFSTLTSALPTRN